MFDAQAEYIRMETLIPAVKAANYNAVKQAVSKGYAEIRRQFTAGEIDAEERAEQVNYLAVLLRYSVMAELFEAIGCEPDDTVAARQAMAADYRAWKEKASMDGAWLTDADGKSVSDLKQKLRIFKTMDALQLSIEDFDDVSPVPAPRWHRKTYGDCELVSILGAEITEDGGFSAEPSPAGKSFTLRDSDGAVYHLNNVRRSNVPGGLSTDGARHFSATGWIDGYTPESETEIEFEEQDGRFVFSYIMDAEADSEAAAMASPLWKAYYEWADARAAARRERLKALY